MATPPFLRKGPGSNNPFATTVDHSNKWPEISPGSNVQQPQQQQSSGFIPSQPTGFYGQGAAGSASGFGGAGGIGGTGAGGGIQSQMTGYGGGGSGGGSNIGGGGGFQPTSAFGQSLGALLYPQNTGGGGGGLMPQQTGWPPQQQQQQQPSQFGQQQNFGVGRAGGYSSEFDPYANLDALGPKSSSSSSTNMSTPSTSSSNSTGATSNSSTAGGGGQREHPRDFFQNHKGGLESWNPRTWAMAGDSLDVLKRAWEVRAKEVRLMLDKGISSQDRLDCERIAKDADSNADSLTAYQFQLKEAISGYRSSTDPRSRQNVRDCLNGGIKNLPEWPGPLPEFKVVDFQQPTGATTVGGGGGGMMGGGMGQAGVVMGVGPGQGYHNPGMGMMSQPTGMGMGMGTGAGSWMQSQPTGMMGMGGNGMMQQQQPQQTGMGMGGMGGYGGMGGGVNANPTGFAGGQYGQQQQQQTGFGGQSQQPFG